MLKPTTVKPPQRQFSSLNVERCLYCKQQGCKGVNTSLAESCNQNGKIGGKHVQELKGVMEENLRTQIRVLEREVQLLRAELCNRSPASLNICSKKDVSTSTSDVQRCGEFQLSNLSLPNHFVVSPVPTVSVPYQLLSADAEEEKEKEHKWESHVNSDNFQNRVDGLVPFATYPSYASSPQERLGTEHLEKHENIVQKLTAQNAELRSKLAEMKSVLEQRDALLLSTSSEKLTLGLKANSVNTLKSTPFSAEEQKATLTTHLLQAQEEVVHLREESQQLKNTLRVCEEQLKSSTDDINSLRSQIQQLTFMTKKKNFAVQQTTTPSQVTSNANVAQLQTMTMVEHVGGQAEKPSTSNLSSAVDAQTQTATTTTTTTTTTTGDELTSIMAELRNLRERLVSSERKVCAWETWYLQKFHKAPPNTSQSQTEHLFGVCDKKRGAPVREGASQYVNKAVVQPPPPQKQQGQRQKQLVKTPTAYVNPCGFFPSLNESATDALAVDTYAFMAREAALRGVTEQQRADLMAVLLAEEWSI